MRGAPYDRKAAVYDRVVGARAYNRVIWGTSTTAYRKFASEALASGTGPMLDAGCGSAVFTAGVYRRASRPLVLVDRSIGMLVRAHGALGGAYLRVLQRAGEVGPPASLAELTAAARQALGDSAAVDRTGSMAWLRARKPAA